ncbi:MAG TPA: hypothetical protein VF026_32550 [Ktedonobacteraceae bacterium]
MTTIDTTIEIDLKELKDAVSAVVKADNAWLSALESFFEGIVETTKQFLKAQLTAVFKSELPQGASDLDEAVRAVLDDIRFVKSTDKRLEAKILQADSTPESLGRAVVEAEAYLILTNEAFTNLKNLSNGIASITSSPAPSDKNFDKLKSKIVQLTSDADSARNEPVNGLNAQISTLLQSAAGSTTVVALPPAEPTGADLLLGRKLNPCSEFFLGLIPPGSKDFTRTLALLEGQRLTLSDRQIKGLTNSWGKAVTSFVQKPLPQAHLLRDFESQESTSLDSIANFLCVHSALETLYDRLETRVTRTDEDILSPDI